MLAKSKLNSIETLMSQAIISVSDLRSETKGPQFESGC